MKKYSALLSLTLLLVAGCGGGSTETPAVVTPPAPTLIGQGAPLTLTGVVSTFAGTPGVAAHVDGTGTAARFNFAYGITTDGTNLFTSDETDHTIRKIVIATGAVTTLAGSAGVSGAADGVGVAARFNSPYSLATDGTNLYIPDRNNATIRKLVIATGAVTTLAGTAGVIGSTDGTGAAARFSNPMGVATDGTSVYVADTNNHAIRKIVIATGAVSTLAGSPGVSGHADGRGVSATFSTINGIATDGINLFVEDHGGTIRKVVIATGDVTTLAGTAGVGGSADGVGAAASFNNAMGLTTDGTNLYLADYGNYTIRKIVIATGAVTTLAGTAGTGGTTDGTGAAARFGHPAGVTTDGTSLFVTDQFGPTVRRIQ